MRVLLRLLAVSFLLLIGAAQAQQFDLRITGAASIAETELGQTTYRVGKYSLLLFGDLGQISYGTGWQSTGPLAGYLSVDGVTAELGAHPFSVYNLEVGQGAALVTVGRFGGCPLCGDLFSFTIPRQFSFFDRSADFRLDGQLLSFRSCFGFVAHSPLDACDPTGFDTLRVAELFSATLANPAAAVPEGPTISLMAAGLLLLLAIKRHVV